MTEIYVIRHVQAEGNLYRHMQGHWDGDVTSLGRLQRDALAERFRDIPVDAVYSSDLYRARFTATAVTRYHPQLRIREDRRLREINVGPWEAVPFANAVWEQPELFDAFHADYPDLPESACIFHIPPIQNDNISTIVLFLQQEMNLNPAAVCGIATNIMYESKGSYSCIGDNGYSAGICQWHNDRFGSLVKFCDMYGYDWFSLEGQLQFLKYELEGPYRGLLDMINTSENSPEGAYEAAYLFCLDFERPEDMTKKAVIRGQDAHDIYYPLWYGR